MRRLPWYSFLYRMFGAQGTFWLWLLIPAALWWTYEPAMIRMANRKPRALLVKEVGTDPAARWVSLEGVQIGFDRRLLRQPDAPNLPPAQVLLDPTDPAAEWWSQTRDLIEPAECNLSTTGALGGLSGIVPSLARKHLVRRFARLEGDPKLYLPSPDNAILLNDPDAPPLSGTPSPTNGNGLHSFDPQTDSQIALVRERVCVDAVVTGVLDETPPVLSKRLNDELSLMVSGHSLQVGRQPRELESIVFGVAAILFLFLGAGLYGARGVPTQGIEEE